MKCPVCVTVELKMADRQGIEVDYCPQCRGVWLDRGELDKIIERSTAFENRAASAPGSVELPYRERYDDDDDYYRDPKYQGPKYRKKKGFLGDMFDIFD